MGRIIDHRQETDKSHIDELVVRAIARHREKTRFPETFLKQMIDIQKETLDTAHQFRLGE